MSFSGVPTLLAQIKTLGVILRRRCIPLMNTPSIPRKSLPLAGRAFALGILSIHSHLCLYLSFKSDLTPSASLATPSRRNSLPRTSLLSFQLPLPISRVVLLERRV